MRVQANKYLFANFLNIYLFFALNQYEMNSTERGSYSYLVFIDRLKVIKVEGQFSNDFVHLNHMLNFVIYSWVGCNCAIAVSQLYITKYTYDKNLIICPGHLYEKLLCIILHPLYNFIIFVVLKKNNLERSENVLKRKLPKKRA